MSQCSAEEAYNGHLDDGAEGLTKEQASHALFDMGHNPTPYQIANFWKSNSKADDDLITVEELQQLYDTLGDPTEALTQAFKVFDYDPDGAISREELETILRTADVFGSGYADETEMIDQIFAAADTNADGKLQLSEFIAMIQSGQAGITNAPIVEDS